LAGLIVQGTGLVVIGDLVVGIVGASIGGWLLPLVGIHLGLGIVAASMPRSVPWCSCSLGEAQQ